MSQSLTPNSVIHPAEKFIYVILVKTYESSESVAEYYTATYDDALFHLEDVSTNHYYPKYDSEFPEREVFLSMNDEHTEYVISREKKSMVPGTPARVELCRLSLKSVLEISRPTKE